MEEELLWNIREEDVMCGIDSDIHAAWITHDFIFILLYNPWKTTSCSTQKHLYKQSMHQLKYINKLKAK